MLFLVFKVWYTKYIGLQALRYLSHILWWTSVEYFQDHNRLFREYIVVYSLRITKYDSDEYIDFSRDMVKKNCSYY